jgi:hypothetical protein
MAVRLMSGWRERRRERARLKQLRTGDSPEKIARDQARGGAPDERPHVVEKLSFMESGALGMFARGQAREKLKDKPLGGRPRS